LRAAVWAALATALAFAYFGLRQRAFSPAVAEARLMALTARIRPHFLFNSINAVLGVMRSDPRRAEAALEELSDLFRVLMQENRELTTLGEELALCRQYLDLERLRLGERLQVRWHLETCPEDALVPPLMLQPLLENAVYHGIEPAADAGEIVIAIGRKADEVLIAITNPWRDDGGHSAGNRMALANIRERLMLFFDLEARIDTSVVGGEYRLRIRLPYRRREA
jgi:two-component system sensor histidine kinase AlgZ